MTGHMRDHRERGDQEHAHDDAAVSAMISLNARITICGRSGDLEVEAT